jgi:hypothetical protein
VHADWPVISVTRPHAAGITLHESDHVANALQVVQGRELDEYLSLTLADLDPHACIQPIGEAVGQFGDSRRLRYRAWAWARLCFRFGTVGLAGQSACQLLRLTDGQPLGDNPIGETLLLLKVEQLQDRARVTG